MGPPPQLPVVAPLPPPQHPHAIYHPPNHNQQTQRQHPNGYQQGYPAPQSQVVGMNRYGPPPMHAMAQQQHHACVHQHQNHSIAPRSFRHQAISHGGVGRHPINVNSSHHHYLPHAAVVGNVAAHGVGLLQSHLHHHRHQYPPRPFHVPPHQSSQHLHAQYSSMIPVSNKDEPTIASGNYASTNPSESESKVKNIEATTAEASVQFVDSATNEECVSGGGCGSTSTNIEVDALKATKDDGVVNNNFLPPILFSAETFVGGINSDVNKATNINITNKARGSAMEKRNNMTVMSPIATCFERMLGAAEAIKTPGVLTLSSNETKRGPLSKKILPLTTSSNLRNRQKSIDGDMNPFDEILDDPDLERLVILEMAMQRNQHFQSATDTPKYDSLPPLPPPPKREISRVIKEGFFWREYPACEQILYNYMPKYYEISAIQKNYKVQQYFNNLLVDEVRKAAKDSGFMVDPEFCDKMLRDRIRCFYKTHLQNAKKRLATLMKHADSFENQCLIAVFIRCVRNPELTFEDSLAMANTITEMDQENVTSGTNQNALATSTKKRKLDCVEEKLKSIITGSTVALSEASNENMFKYTSLENDMEPI